MSNRPGIVFAALVSLLFSLSGCGGSGSVPPQQVLVRVSISPSQATVAAGANQLFFASVTGTANHAVTWKVNGTVGGDATSGTIDVTGLYTAPSTIPNPATVTAAASAQADPTRSGNAGGAISGGVPAVNQATQSAPIKLGPSGGNANDQSGGFCCSGTLGALVTRGGTDFILSNNHVLARTDLAVAGEPITQPGLVDNSCTPATPVANFTQKVKLKNNPSNIAPADAALAQVISGEVDTTGAILQLGAVTGGLAQPAPPSSTIVAPAIGMQVAKSGRTTGLT